jgi:hypothetical protein
MSFENVSKLSVITYIAYLTLVSAKKHEQLILSVWLLCFWYVHVEAYLEYGIGFRQNDIKTILPEGDVEMLCSYPEVHKDLSAC